MKKSVLRNFLLTLVVLLWGVVSCEQPEEKVDVPYLELSPESCEEIASGDGDGLLISIRSNVSWTISAVDSNNSPVEWMIIESPAGKGDADILCFILKGSLEAERSCKIVVCSEDGKINKSLDIIQGKFVPTLVEIDFVEVLKKASSQEVGIPGQLTEFTKSDVEVIGVPGANIPDGYVYITDDGKAWARLKIDQTSTIHVGDLLEINYTGGSITKESGETYTLELQKEPVVLSSGSPSVAPVYIPSNAISSYENMLVELRNVQAPENVVGAVWDGDVSLIATDEKDAVFSVHVDSGAEFGNVGAGSGTIRGVVIDGKLCPRNAEDVSGLTGSRIPAYSEPYKISPIINVIKNGESNDSLVNGEITGKTKLTFTSSPGYSVVGASIEKVLGGTDNNMKIAATSTTAPFNSCFTTVQWHLDGTYLLFTIPVSEKTYGDLEFSFSMSCAQKKFTDVWTVSWSLDGLEFNPVDAIYSSSVYTAEAAAGSTYALAHTNVENNRQVVEFTIPENNAVSSGNIYIKLMHPAIADAGRTLRINCGSVLSSRTTNTTLIEYDNLLFMENFGNCLFGHNPVIGIPTYHFTTLKEFVPNNSYSSTEGWTVTGKSFACRGCLRLSSDSGANFITSPGLSMLELPADITVSFKVAPFVNATAAELVVHEDNIKVAVTGSGTVGTIEWDKEYAPYQWRTGTVRITGASSDTRIQIGNIDGASLSQCYIDDIIITR